MIREALKIIEITAFAVAGFCAVYAAFLIIKTRIDANKALKELEEFEEGEYNA